MINKRLKDVLFTDQWSEVCMERLSPFGYVLVSNGFLPRLHRRPLPVKCSDICRSIPNDISAGGCKFGSFCCPQPWPEWLLLTGAVCDLLSALHALCTLSLLSLSHCLTTDVPSNTNAFVHMKEELNVSCK